MKRPLPKGAKRVSEKKDAREVFRGTRWSVFQWDQEEFNGQSVVYETIARHHDSVIILPFVDDSIILVKEKQPHWEEASIGYIAGGMEPGESIVEAAKRECEEETGLVFKDFYLVNIEQYVTGADWFGYTFIAKNVIKKTKMNLDSGEQIEPVKVSINEIIRMTRNMEFYRRSQFLENFLVRDRVDELREAFVNPEKFEIKS